MGFAEGDDATEETAHDDPFFLVQFATCFVQVVDERPECALGALEELRGELYQHTPPVRRMGTSHKMTTRFEPLDEGGDAAGGDAQELAEGGGRQLTVLRDMRDREHPGLG